MTMIRKFYQWFSGTMGEKKKSSTKESLSQSSMNSSKQDQKGGSTTGASATRITILGRGEIPFYDLKEGMRYFEATKKLFPESFGLLGSIERSVGMTEFADYLNGITDDVGATVGSIYAQVLKDHKNLDTKVRGAARSGIPGASEDANPASTAFMIIFFASLSCLVRNQWEHDKDMSLEQRLGNLHANASIWHIMLKRQSGTWLSHCLGEIQSREYQARNGNGKKEG